MNPFKLFKKKTEKTHKVTGERKSYGYYSEDPFIIRALAGDRVTQLSNTEAMRMYRRNSSIATAVDMISDAFTQINPVIQDNDGNFIMEHELLSFLRQPNPQQTYHEFASAYIHSYLITGNSYIAAFGNVNSKPLEIHPIKPQQISTYEDTDNYAKSYIISDGVGCGSYERQKIKKRDRYLTRERLRELYHVMNYSSNTTDVKGDSLIQAAMIEVSQMIEGRNLNLQTILKGGNLGLAVIFNDGEIDDYDGMNGGGTDQDIHKERTEQVRDALGGSNGERIAVLSGNEVSIQEFGKTNKDMDYLNLDKMASEAIYSRYGIPLPLISTDASTFNNMSTAVRMFYDFSVLPATNILFEGIQKFLFPRFGIDGSEFKLTYNPMSIPVLKERLIDEIAKRHENNIETVNELRKAFGGKDPVDGGDSILINATQVPIGEPIEDIETIVEEISEDG